jgi:hypothetical protein
MEPNAQSNPLSGLHKQKLYCLILAGVGLIALLLPWRTISGFSVASLIALLGVGGIVAATFMGDKTKPYEGQTRMIALASFAAIALAAILVIATKVGVAGARGYKISTSPGMGLFLGIAVAAAGLLYLMGIIKIPEKPTGPKP